MSKSSDKYTRRSARNTYISTVISISLVLFVLGLVGMTLLSAQKLSDHVRKNVKIQVYLNQGQKQVEINQFQKKLDAEPFVNRTDYLDPEVAAEEFRKELGEDFIDFLGYNPLPPAIEIELRPEYAYPDSIARINDAEVFLANDAIIEEIRYNKTLLTKLNENIKVITIALLFISALLLAISLALINNTIRLSIYSRRFLIKTMQLVGATSTFIRRPFITRGILQGLFSAFIAIGLLLGMIYGIARLQNELVNLADLKLLLFVFAAVLAIGILITYLSTFLAVRKYLRLRSDDLY